MKTLERGVFVRAAEGHQQTREICDQEKAPKYRNGRGNHQHRENPEHQRSAHRVAQYIAGDVPPEKRHARRHEVLVLIFRPEKPLVELGQKPLDAHGQKKHLHPSKREKIGVTGQGREIQNAKNRKVKINASGKGSGLKILVGRVLKRAPQRRVQPRDNADAQAEIEIHRHVLEDGRREREDGRGKTGDGRGKR